MINWCLQKRKLRDLKPYQKNARTLSVLEKKHICHSLDQYGLIEKLIVNQDDVVIGGHQRLGILLEKGLEVIECWVPDRLLSEKEVEELNIRLNKNTGSWDFDFLANAFEVDDLLDYGFSEIDLGLDKEPKPTKKSKPVISLEFTNESDMNAALLDIESISGKFSCKLKVRS